MATSLAEFSVKLREIVGEPTANRPFVCEGSPLDCRTFIVGLNPATEMKRSFWDFWDDHYGFRKADWLVTYKVERKAKPLKPGRTQRREFSTTRSRIEGIVTAAMPIKCLETNIYSRPTERGIDLRRENGNTAPFEFLLRTIQSAVILLHGEDALEYMHKTYSMPKRLDAFATISLEYGPAQVLALPHLSYVMKRDNPIQWNKQRERQVGVLLWDAVPKNA